MNQKMNYAIVLPGFLTLFLISSSAGGYAFEEFGYGNKGGMQGGGLEERKKHFMDQMVKDLGLTEEQQSKIKEQRELAASERQKLQEALFAKQGELRTELGKTEIDRSKIDAIVDDLSELHGTKIKNRVDTILGIRSILTPEQFAEFQKRMESKKEGRRKFFEKRRERLKGGSRERKDF